MHHKDPRNQDRYGIRKIDASDTFKQFKLELIQIAKDTNPLEGL